MPVLEIKIVSARSQKANDANAEGARENAEKPEHSPDKDVYEIGKQFMTPLGDDILIVESAGAL